MGLFDKIFEKKICAICGGEIGLLGNKKLEDGNMCKNCAAKLSPWFSDRRNGTVEEIKQQLEYREANQLEVEKFNTTMTLGEGTKVYIDEDARKFIVTSNRNFKEANPDVIPFSQVTGCDIDVSERHSEEKRKDAEGKMVSYNPPRYKFEYDFYFEINLNNPYFDNIRFRLNSYSIKTTPDVSVPMSRKPNPKFNAEYREYEKVGEELKAILLQARQQVRDEAAQAAAPKEKLTCPWCGATTIPDANGCCEYCGGSFNG